MKYKEEFTGDLDAVVGKRTEGAERDLNSKCLSIMWLWVSTYILDSMVRGIAFTFLVSRM